MTVIGAAVFVLLALLLIPPAGSPFGFTPAYAADGDRFVSAAGDDSANDCTVEANPCATLQHAVDEANDGDTIYVLTSLDEHSITISKSLTIRKKASEASEIVIDANQLGRVFSILDDAEAEIAGLTITGGSVIGNGLGGGIYNTGVLTLTDSAVSQNTVGTVFDFGLGGGIYNSGGSLSLIRSTVSGNTATLGGGIYSESIQDRDTGEISAFASVVLTSSTVSQNQSIGGQIGGGGGGIYNSGGSLTLISSTISGNTAQGSAPSAIFGPELGAAGGGIYNTAILAQIDNAYIGHPATLTLVNSTVSGNAAGIIGMGGGVASTGIQDLGSGIVRNTVTLINSTVSGNTATQGGLVLGGGVLTSFDTMTLTNSTISNNAFSGIASYGQESGSIVTLTNTLLAGQAGGVNCVGDIVIAATSSLVDDDTCGFTNGVSGNIVVAAGAAGLGPLQDNGGATFTHALLPGSPAIDTGDDTPCGQAYDPDSAPTASGAYDQRGEGYPRSIGAACDIGAFETGMVLTKTASPDTAPSTGGYVTYTIAIQNSIGREATLIALEDDVFGDLLDSGNDAITATNCAEGDVVVDGDSYRCWFIAFLFGEDGEQHENTVTAELQPAGPPPENIGPEFEALWDTPIVVSGSEIVMLEAPDAGVAPACSDQPLSQGSLETPRCLVIVKETASGSRFRFEVNVGYPEQGPQDYSSRFNLRDGDTAGFDLGIAGTVYTIRETQLGPGWTLVASCEGEGIEVLNTPVKDGIAVRYTGDPGPNEPYAWAVCTFLNLEPPSCGSGAPTAQQTPAEAHCLIIVKRTAPDAMPQQQFSFRHNGTPFQLSHDGLPRTIDIGVPGSSHTVTEELPSGWSLSIDCDNRSGVSITPVTNGVTVSYAGGLPQGQSAYAVCVFTNVPPPVPPPPIATVTPSPRPRPNIGGIFLPGGNTSQVAPATATPVQIRPPSTGDGGLR